MARSSPSAPEDIPFALVLPATSFIAGSIVTGSIVLDLARAQDIALTSVRLKLRGTTQTIVMHALLPGPRMPGRPECRENNTFLSLATASEAPLWTPGAVFPTPGIHRIELPFAFELPHALPPTFNTAGRADDGAGALSARVEYTLVALGTRRGLFKRELRVEQSVRVTSAAGPADVAVKTALYAGAWAGAWKVLATESRLSGGPREGFYMARAEIALPDSSSHAVDTVLPCRLRIVISSVTKSQTPATTSAASPAESLEQVQLLLATRTSVRAESSRGGATTYKSAGILRPASATSAAAPAPIPWSLTHPAEHGDAETSRCCELFFEGDLLLSGVPTFTAPNVAVSHALCMRLVIPGLTSRFDAQWAVDLNSGLQPPPPPFSEAAPVYCA